MTDLEEVSAGGVVRGDKGLLMVRVSGSGVWTFPKGHMEPGETLTETALREVQEETGWLCRIEKPFRTVHYVFSREDRQVQKTVHWYLMSPLKKVGDIDPVEILECRWVLLEEAKTRVVYNSDKEILGALL
jgi:8-oxo-dGTP pyrophosphatase MutT (NUDIX family)